MHSEMMCTVCVNMFLFKKNNFTLHIFARYIFTYSVNIYGKIV